VVGGLGKHGLILLGEHAGREEPQHAREGWHGALGFNCGDAGSQWAAHLVQQLQQLRPLGPAYVRLGPFSQVQTFAPLAA